MNFTDGTPLRLRTVPSLDTVEIQQMPEGTEFNVIGVPACENADAYYRFWQVQLDDDTIGWAAEANNTTYFIKPVVSTPTPTAMPTPTPTPNCPCNIFGSSIPTNPSWNDSSAVEVRLRFRASEAGEVTGVRFYKGSDNTGTHTGHLWTNAGTLLGSVTFSGETSTGWQEATFSTPISISANTTYVVSYHAPNGHYSVDRPALVSAVNNPPLKALADDEDDANGVYAYGSSGTFPANAPVTSTNYWVDVIFVPGT